ncbi:neurotrypsin isoform X1 [Strongylocentrotus purpuratus]|uniref:SRCR domain-containing protein n=1 Tax=Strongylocentrotus purpuratus TaxID=7668 RepID=A0A7M7P3B0_STRPU|nr:neurotrypsin isoform X1 [Strongylocentrotus purpuratus]
MMEGYTILSLLLCLGVASAYSNYDVRLAGTGSNAANGRVEMFYDGAWGTVCNDYWGMNDASVVCKQLGFSEGASAAIRSPSPFGAGSGRVLLSTVACTGRENLLYDCNAKKLDAAVNCDHNRDAAVRCRGTQTAVYREGALRLAGSGSSANQGRVEVYANKQWGTVCDDYWGQNDANVVCRQLGFIGASGFKRKAETFGQGTGAILLDNVNCVGNEASIVDCPMNDIGDEDCTHSEDAGVICRVPVRLAGSGSSANQGRVEVYAEGQWGTVCDDHWGQEDANVVCRQLGFPGASDFTRMAETFGEGTGAILLDNVNCVGNEASIVDCRMNDIGDEDCTHSEDAGVICRAIRVAGAKKIEGLGWGIVEVYRDGQWGTVCGVGFTEMDTNVACRQLGFPTPSSYYFRHDQMKFFGAGTGPISLTGVTCQGDEASIMDCDLSSTAMAACTHAVDAEVLCKPATRKREGEDMETIHKIQEQLSAAEVSVAQEEKKDVLQADLTIAAAPVSDGKNDEDLKEKDVLQALSDLLAELKDK